MKISLLLLIACLAMSTISQYSQDVEQHSDSDNKKKVKIMETLFSQQTLRMTSFGKYRSKAYGQISYPFASISQSRTNFFGFFKGVHDARRMNKYFWHGMQSTKVNIYSYSVQFVTLV